VGLRPPVRHPARPRRRRELRRAARRHHPLPPDDARRLRARLRVGAVTTLPASTRSRGTIALVAAALLAATLFASVLLGAGCTSPPPPTRGILNVSVEQGSAWLRNFNPFLAGTARWPTRGGIYEPLLIWNAAAGKWVPW